MSAASADGREALERARDHHRRGEYALAIDSYASLLERDPSSAAVWHLKAMAEHQSGQLDAALQSARRATEVGGEQAPFVLIEGNVLQDRGELDAAEERFRRVVQMQPEWIAGHVALGQVRMDLERPAEALESFRAAVALDPSHVRSWNNIGVALQSLERPEEATEAYARAIAIDPRYALAHFNFARLSYIRDPKTALRHAQAAVQADPSLADAWLLIGNIHRRGFAHPQALAAYSSAARSDPSNVMALNARAGALVEIGDVAQGRAEFAAVAARFPGNVTAALGANLTLPRVYSGLGHLEESRREFAAGLERLHASVPHFTLARPDAALEEARWTNFYLAYQGLDDRPLQVRYAELQRRVLQPVLPELFARRPARSHGARIRVGFLSHFFFNCVAGRYFSSWITHLDRERFESFVYYTNDVMADDTKSIAAAAGTFRHLAGQPLHSIARQVIADELDILVYPELGMHPETFALSGLRLAPVQCAAWGHPTTSGSPEMDWFISCAEMEPPDGARHYSERLALLPGIGTRYAMPEAQGGGSRSDFGIPEERTAYLIPQSLFKIHPDNDDLIAEILARDPRGVAVMFSSSQERLTHAFKERLRKSFAARGLELDERAVFLKPNLQHAAYLRLNQLCDVMLDNLRWSGGNTSLDAFASGLPVVTLPGELMRGRQSQAMLRMMGLDELVARDRADYLDKVLELGRDRERRESVAAKIVARRGALFEREEPIRALEEFLERAAREP